VPHLIPSAADLKATYPAFDSVSDAVVAVHISRAATQAVDASWPEGEFTTAAIDYAAHTMALVGLGASDETTRYQRAGVTSIRTGQFSASFSDQAVSKAAGGGLDSTPYGRAYKLALRRVKGGARIVAPAPDCDGWGFVARTNDGTVLPWGS
jgi:hypothetical protein